MESRVAVDRSTDIRAADRYFSSHEVSEILGVTPSSVVKWIGAGLLSAFRTPGGHRRVSATELVRFSWQHGMPIPEALRGLAISKVLVADDDSRFLSAIKRAFKVHADEFRLQTADNGVEALMWIGCLKPDVLILDVHMPGLDGFDVLKRLKANPHTEAMTVIAISGQMDADTSAGCKKLGATMCLEKPAPVSDLLKTLRELLKPSHTWSR
jgi:excisionase family DNA binding protein